MTSCNDRIREGFICPVCMVTLDHQEALLNHVSSQHPDGAEDVLDHLKGWLGRMGKKLKMKGEEMTASAMSAVESGGGASGGGSGAGSGRSSRRGSVQANFAFYEDPNHFQELGKTVAHTDEFLTLRAQRISHTHREQDRLLLRLEKLMRIVEGESAGGGAGGGSGGGGGGGASGSGKGLAIFTSGNAAMKRKAAQKALVPWAEDKDVPICPICAAQFNRLTRRKHHCRLCGYVMCADCSNFLSENAARRIISPPEEAADALAELGSTPSFLSRSNSETSIASLPLNLNSYMPWSSNSPPSSGEPSTPRERTLRVCTWCREVLEGVMRQREKHTPTPIIVQLYDQLQSALQSIKDEIGSYEEMLNAVKQGRSEDLNSLLEHRNRLLRLANFADDCSRQITTLPTPTDRAMAEAAEQGIVLPKKGLAKLQSNIRSMVAHSLTHSPALGLLRQQPPSAEECDRLVKEQRRALQRQREGSALRKARDREDSCTGMGWTPAPPGVAAPELHEDPLEQQIANIREYARLARDAGKYEELMILEDNLKMLEAERKTQRQKR